MTEPTKGTTIGNYEVLSELGRGGMGVVYKAHEQSLQRVVALKVLPSHLASNDDFVKRFLREARSAAQLNHPNIVITHAVGESDGHYYIAMEFVKGSALNDLIREQGQMNIPNALKIVGQVSQALLEAHRHNIIHRDIKPHNIMIDLTGRARVMDFGLAYIGDESAKLTQSGALIGTPVYMSPEQCRGEKLGPESDIFALGITLYEMLAGRVPYNGDSPLAIMHQIVNEPIRPITEYNSRVPDSVIKLLKKMLERDRSKRYHDMFAVATDIKTILRSDTLLNLPGGADPTLILKTKEKTITPEPIEKQPETPQNPAEPSPVSGLEWESYPRLKRSLRLIPILLLATAVAFAAWEFFPRNTASEAPQANTPSPPDDAPWKELTQGNTMTGWTARDNSGNTGQWSMLDGVISNHIAPNGNMSQQSPDLKTIGEYQDFELTLDYRIAAGANSGIFLRGLVEIQLVGKEHLNSRKPPTAPSTTRFLLSSIPQNQRNNGTNCTFSTKVPKSPPE